MFAQVLPLVWHTASISCTIKKKNAQQWILIATNEILRNTVASVLERHRQKFIHHSIFGAVSEVCLAHDWIPHFKVGPRVKASFHKFPLSQKLSFTYCLVSMLIFLFFWPCFVLSFRSNVFSALSHSSLNSSWKFLLGEQFWFPPCLHTLFLSQILPLIYFWIEVKALWVTTLTMVSCCQSSLMLATPCD